MLAIPDVFFGGKKIEVNFGETFFIDSKKCVGTTTELHFALLGRMNTIIPRLLFTYYPGRNIKKERGYC